MGDLRRTMSIRLAISADANVLAEIGRKTFLETFAAANSAQNMALYLEQTFSPEKQGRELIDPNRRIAIAWIDAEPIGYYHLHRGLVDPSVVGEQPIELLRFYVDSKWHGKGVGPELMQSCLAAVKSEGFSTLWLGVWEHNLRAQSFYRKHGFSTVGSHVFRLGLDEQTDLIMARTLN
jgi:ribosomal protein S18 acetylase RimI-like enzyme